MFAVIFEVNPKPELWDDYLRYAKLLKPELENIDGFIDNERFASQRRDGWLVSLSTWRDEKALIRWRTLAIHHAIQERGRSEVFRDYRLRVGEISADTHLPDGADLRQQRFDETQTGRAKIATLTESDRPVDAQADQAAVQVEWDLFESIYQPGKLLLLNFWINTEAARSWVARAPRQMRHRTVRIIRDYGMFAREEAPQYYPPAAGAHGGAQ